jgi:hypothetical protein
MPKPNEKLAESLAALQELQKAGGAFSGRAS